MRPPRTRHVWGATEAYRWCDEALNIVTHGKTGAPWQLSIGDEVEATELVQEGKRTVNGVEHDALFYHVTKATLREVSVVEMRRRNAQRFEGKIRRRRTRRVRKHPRGSR